MQDCFLSQVLVTCSCLGYDCDFYKECHTQAGYFRVTRHKVFSPPSAFSPPNPSEWPRVAAPEGHAGSADPGDRNRFSTVTGESLAS